MEQKISQLTLRAIPSGKVLENCRETYPHIQLTDEEEFEALLAARKAKHIRIKNAEYWEKVRQGPEYLKLDAVGFQKMIIDTNPHFKVDSQSERIFRMLFAYFMGDSHFETLDETFSLQKGIMLTGPVGVGKTAILKLFQNNPKCGFRMVNAREVSKQFSQQGFEAIDQYCGSKSTTPDRFGNTEIGLFIDDFGTDEARKNFGNETNPILDIVLRRYDTCPRYTTHFTTNMNPDEIEDYYGKRVRSRLKEMVNFIEYRGQDRRK